MLSKKDLQLLDANKADRLKVQKGLPAKHEGKNGDLSVRQVPSGLSLYGKFHDKWYRVAKLEDITRDGQAVMGKGDDREFHSIGVKDNIHFNRGSKTLELKNEGGSLIADVKDPTIDTVRKLELRRAIGGGDPTIQLGSSDTECLQIAAKYPSGGKGMDYAEIRTKSGSISANKGQIYVVVDDVQKLQIDDDGLDVNGAITASTTITATGDLTVGGGDVTITAANDAAASILMQADDSDDAGDDWKIIANADQTLSIGNDIASAGSYVTHLDITPNALTRISLVSAKGHISVPAPSTAGTGGKVYFDGGGDTYIYEYIADYLRFIVGGDLFISLIESGTSGNTVLLNAATGFLRKTTTYSDNDITSSGGTNDTDVDFRFANSQYLQLTGDIAGDLNFIFPTIISNTFTLILNQDSSGSHTVDDYKAFTAHDDSSPTDLIWAGGSEPTLTATANKSDIISIFWDATASKAYATIELNF